MPEQIKINIKEYEVVVLFKTGKRILKGNPERFTS